MAALAEWRQRRGLTGAQVAGAIGVSEVMLDRIEGGEVEPARETAMLLHVLTGGEIGVCCWPGCADWDPVELQAVGARGVSGWGVVILAGCSPVRWMTATEARALAGAITLAADSIEARKT